MNFRKKLNLGVVAGLAGLLGFTVLDSNGKINYAPNIPTNELVSSEPAAAELDGIFRKEIISTKPVTPIVIEMPQALSDEDYVNNLFLNSNSPFSLVSRDKYEKSHGFFPTQEGYSGFYNSLCANFSNNSLETIAQTIPRGDPVWVDLPEIWNLVYNAPHEEGTTLKDVYAEYIPTKESLTSEDWTPEKRKLFSGIVELSLYDNIIDGFYIRESVRTRDLSNEAIEDIEIDMLDYMPFIRNNLGATPDAARLEGLISDYGRSCILEVSGQVEEGTSDLISQKIYRILESQRENLESQYDNSQLTDMLRLNRAFNDHSE